MHSFDLFCEKNRVKVVRMLLTVGANVNHKTINVCGDYSLIVVVLIGLVDGFK